MTTDLCRFALCQIMKENQHTDVKFSVFVAGDPINPTLAFHFGSVTVAGSGSDKSMGRTGNH